jgi:hypothetical protein
MKVKIMSKSSKEGIKRLEKRVKEEILKTGLPTEIRATRMLEKNGWNVFNEFPFLDEEGKKIRTIDIRASKFFLKSRNKKSTDHSDIDLFCELYIECKKSVKQFWVFYQQHAPDPFIKLALERLAYDVAYNTHNLTIRSYGKTIDNDRGKEKIRSLLKPTTVFSRIPVRFENMDYKIGLSHQLVFATEDGKRSGGKKEGKNQFYDAEMKVLKALYHRDKERKTPSLEDSPKENIIPIILFDGYLFECYYDNGEIVTPRIEYTRYLAHGLPHQRMPTLIDVMTLNYFPKYLELLEEELSKSRKGVHARSKRKNPTQS